MYAYTHTHTHVCFRIVPEQLRGDNERGLFNPRESRVSRASGALQNEHRDSDVVRDIAKESSNAALERGGNERPLERGRGRRGVGKLVPALGERRFLEGADFHAVRPPCSRPLHESAGGGLWLVVCVAISSIISACCLPRY